MVDEVEERRLGPLEVVEDDDEWLLAGQSLEDAARLERDLVAVGAEVDLARRPAGSISASGQYVIPSPYGRQRPESTRRIDAVLELSDEPATSRSRPAPSSVNW